ncbi:MAG: alpha/beta hydrolase-fold protein [Chloroherpetonaceae bacterium]|nr:esterase family protein [Chthonomonadaceae bacterium]MDW8208160.1 alpha/beta hydrolase-fold protein [Chloroherpetonaceae bacterium]
MQTSACWLLRAGIALLWLILSGLSQALALRFSVTYPESVFAGPFTGKVVVYLSRHAEQPRLGPDWFHPEPMYSQKFRDVPPGSPMVIDETATGFPGKLSQLPPGEYRVQAVIDRNLGGRSIGESPGNLYSEAARMRLDPAEDRTIQLVCDRVVRERRLRETPRLREVRVVSQMLSRFYGRTTTLNAAVSLPAEWERDPDRKFPVLYEVPGFGGRHHGGIAETLRGGEPFIVVRLDPDCPGGHSVFADSANNGPWGQALTTELIPVIEKRFRGVGRPEGRFVTGHSSGGWSSLWLQITYPDFFGGCWATAPDPVDFRDFLQINLYQPGENMFYDRAGRRRPLAREGSTPVLFFKDFSDMERPIRGEQLGSFEYVFSPRGADGEPMRLWDRDTGAIHSEVAEAWKKYDIGLILRTRWPELEPKLRGKIHIYMGDQDTFYLEGAVKLLQQDLKRLNADAVVEIVPGDHGSMLTPELRARMGRQMAERYRRALRAAGQDFARPPANRQFRSVELQQGAMRRQVERRQAQ